MIGNSVRRSVEVSWLKQHPRQNEFFPLQVDAEVDQLADDLENRGQQEPIHCSADGTIIRGHRRVMAARQLGWTMIDAVIRHDLGGPTSEAAVNEMILDNYMRQQLDPLTMARCYQHLKKSSARDGARGGDVRDYFAKCLGTMRSGRTLDRLARLLKLPIELQRLYSRGELTKSAGEEILRLPVESQNALAQAVHAGVPIKQLLKDYEVQPACEESSTRDVGQGFLNMLKNRVPQLRRHVDDLGNLQVHGANATKVLDDAIGFLTEWRDLKRELLEKSFDEKLPKCVGRKSRTN